MEQHPILSDSLEQLLRDLRRHLTWLPITDKTRASTALPLLQRSEHMLLHMQSQLAMDNTALRAALHELDKLKQLPMMQAQAGEGYDWCV